MMITLKHLARDIGQTLQRDVDPYKVRSILRNKFGNVKGRRWRWPTTQDGDYKAKRKAVMKELRT